MKKYLKFEYFYIVLILVWPVLNAVVFSIDGAGRTIFFMTLILIAIDFKKRNFIKMAFSRPLIIYGLWVVYAFINRLINGSHHDELPYITFFVIIAIPYFLMLTTSFLAINDFEKVINVLVFGMYMSIVIIILFSYQSVFGDRYAGEINSNTIGISSTILIMLLYLQYYNKNYSIKILVFLSIIPFIVVISTGSRTAFGGLVLIIITHLYLNRPKTLLLAIIKFSAVAVLLLLMLNYILYNTTLGERILSTTEQSEEGKDIVTGNIILDKFGDRGIFYYLGWQLFKENPIFGIGLNNYIFYTDFDQEQHSEYMIQLAELGIVGFLLFSYFYFSIFSHLIKLRKTGAISKSKEIYYAYIIIILVMITVTRMYSAWYLFSIIGISIGYISKQKSIEERKYQIMKSVNKIA